MRAVLVGLALLMAAVGCGSGVINTSGNNNDPSGRPGGPGGGSNGPSGPGGPSMGGGGSSPGGGNGPGSPSLPSTPAPMPSDAGAAVDGPPAGQAPPGCQVTITALNPPRLTNLLAGGNARLRVQARVTGSLAPPMPAWQWQVQLTPLSDVAVTKLTPEGDIVEFPLAAEGFYDIQASADSMCTSKVTARAFRAGDRVTTYWARVTPSRSSELVARESQIRLGGPPPAQPPVIQLSRGLPVAIDPQNAQRQAISSYIRITSPVSSVRFEGNNLSQAFKVSLASDRPYDVLIVPDGPVAPVLLAGRSVTDLQNERFMFDPGLAVTGTIRRTLAAAVEPVTGARVFLRAGNLPSAIGQSTASGGFELRAREGAFQVSVIPAAGSGLPEARLPDGTTYSPATQPGALQLTYAAIQATTLDLVVRSSDGQRPVDGARVRLDAEPASLGTMGNPGIVGSFRLPPDDREVPALGALRVEATTGATGTASFGRLPFGRYRALVAPPAGMANAATTVATIEVRSGMAPPAITLVRPVKLTGRLLPVGTWTGLKLLAIEADGPSPGEALAATVDAMGQFGFSVAPGRTYRLQIEPAQDRKLPRLFLGPHTAGVADSSYGDLNLPEGVPYVGVVGSDSGPVPDAVVQIFCTGAAPDCMAEVAPQLESARPIAETRAGPDGRFQVYLPNPASWDL